jgi:hypothetical protein
LISFKVWFKNRRAKCRQHEKSKHGKHGNDDTLNNSRDSLSPDIVSKNENDSNKDSSVSTPNSSSSNSLTNPNQRQTDTPPISPQSNHYFTSSSSAISNNANSIWSPAMTSSLVSNLSLVNNGLNGIITPSSSTSPPLNTLGGSTLTTSPTYLNYQNNNNSILQPQQQQQQQQQQQHELQQNHQQQLAYENYYNTNYLTAQYQNGLAQNPYRHLTQATDYMTASVIPESLQNPYGLQRPDMWSHKFHGF